MGGRGRGKAPRVHISREACREIMKSEGAQRIVTEKAQAIADACNASAGLSAEGYGYVVHPRVLTVSAHAFVDCGGIESIIDNHRNGTILSCFWENQEG